MRFIVFVHATANSEAGVMPTEEQLSAMADFNERIVEAGLMRGGEGLHPSSSAIRLTYKDGAVTDATGPFTEGPVVSGFWLLEADSIDVVTEWLREAPFKDETIEIRQIFEAEDFGDALTPELKAREDEMRRRSEG